MRDVTPKPQIVFGRGTERRGGSNWWVDETYSKIKRWLRRLFCLVDKAGKSVNLLPTAHR